MADDQHWVSIIFYAEDDWCIVDQITNAEYHRKYGGRRTISMTAHYTAMRRSWPNGKTYFRKPEWEAKHGKIEYP